MFYSLRLLETLKVIITLNSKFSILNLKRLSIYKTSSLQSSIELCREEVLYYHGLPPLLPPVVAVTVDDEVPLVMV